MALDEQVLAELIALRKAVAEQTTGLAVNTEIVTGLKRTLEDVRGNAVPRGEWVESRRSDDQRFGAIEDDVKTLFGDKERRLVAREEEKKADQSFRRAVLLGFGLAAFSGFISVATLIIQFIFGK